MGISTGISPFLAFATTVHRTAATLETATFVEERWAPRMRIPIFDVAALRALLDEPARRYFLVELLASYTRVTSGVTWARGAGLAAPAFQRTRPEPAGRTPRGRRPGRTAGHLPPPRRPRPVPAGRVSGPPVAPRYRGGRRPAPSDHRRRVGPGRGPRSPEPPRASRGPMSTARPSPPRPPPATRSRQPSPSPGTWPIISANPARPQRRDGSLPLSVAAEVVRVQLSTRSGSESGPGRVRRRRPGREHAGHLAHVHWVTAAPQLDHRSLPRPALVDHQQDPVDRRRFASAAPRQMTPRVVSPPAVRT